MTPESEFYIRPRRSAAQPSTWRFIMKQSIPLSRMVGPVLILLLVLSPWAAN
jgi:hypothetical protein